MTQINQRDEQTVLTFMLTSSVFHLNENKTKLKDTIRYFGSLVELREAHFIFLA